VTKTVPHRTGRENLLGTGYTFGLARYNYQCTSVSTAEPLLSICALRLKRRRWRELDPGCMCQQWGTVLSQLRFDRGVDGRAHCSSRGRTGAWATARTRTQTRLCVFTVGRCNQPSPAHEDPLDPQPVAPTLLILSTALPENLEVARPAHHRTSTNLWTAANPEVSD